MTYRWYVGIHSGTPPMLGTYEAFRCAYTPSAETFGSVYMAVIGPFKTKRGAEFMAKHGKGNPHCQDVASAERLALEAA